MRAPRTTVALTGLLAALLVAGVPVAQAEEPDPCDTAAAEAAAAQAASSASVVAGPGYVVLDPGASGVVAPDGTFLPTGDLPEGTLVVVREPDGSLPGGISLAELEELLAAQARGDLAPIEEAGFSVPGTGAAGPPGAGSEPGADG